MCHIHGATVFEIAGESARSPLVKAVGFKRLSKGRVNIVSLVGANDFYQGKASPKFLVEALDDELKSLVTCKMYL